MKRRAISGARPDLQAARVREIVTDAGNAIEYVSLPTMGHFFHDQDPASFSETLTSWVDSLAVYLPPPVEQVGAHLTVHIDVGHLWFRHLPAVKVRR